MSSLRTGAVVCACLVSVVAATGPQDRPAPAWPPSFGSRPDGPAPVLSPDEAMTTFVLPPGYHLELVASEPLVRDPVVVDFDPAGRMWLIEMPGYMGDVRASDELEPTGRVVVLEDTDRDGRMDKRTVFAEGLVLPRSLKVLDRGVLVAEPPDLWLMIDADGDLQMDRKERVTNYGTREANVEHNANGLTWAIDNWMHTSETNMYLRLTPDGFEVRPTLSRGQWGNSQDDGGRIFRNSNSSVLHVDTVPTPYFTRNPNLLRTRGSYESLLGPNGEVNEVFPVRPTPGVNRGYQFGILRADGSLATYTAVHSPVVYRGDRLPAELQGNVFVAEPSGNLVSRIVVSDSGTGIVARRAYERAEFLVSTDERFRPVYLSNAPDGTLYVVDMYRGIIQHRGYITEYLYDQIKARHLEPPTGLGRIYRVVHESTRRDHDTMLAAASPAQLVAALSHPNGWWRDTAQRLLVERRDPSVRQALAALVTSAPDWRTRLHALWTLDGMDAAGPATVRAALADPARDVRVGAVRVSERWLEEDAELRAAVLALIDDGDWAVRQQLAASLGAVPVGDRAAAAVALLERHATDPVVVDATISSLRGVEVDVLERLLAGTAGTPQRVTAVSMLAATVIRVGEGRAVLRVLDLAADSGRPGWQQSAVLHGAEVAILGATPPGNPAAGRGRATAAAVEAPCPTCPGGRAGPGGASAFGQARGGGAGQPPAAAGVGRAGAAVAGRGGGRGGGPILMVPQEPLPLSARAASGGDLGARAAALLARIEWPGKPGAALPVPPLTAAEQARFDAGRQVYANLCVACHREDGRGGDRLAPSLLGSELALGDAGIPIRILLHGKEGPVGLMPPLGQVFSDAQVAEVLTYVRRSWGNVGDPVDAAVVGQVRSGTATRSSPWTNEELNALAPVP